MPDPGQTIEEVFREEAGKITAALIRLSGSFDWAEEALQDAFASALVNWPKSGMPQNPGAWIMTVARNRLLDLARREQTRTTKEDALTYWTESQASNFGRPDIVSGNELLFDLIKEAKVERAVVDRNNDARRRQCVLRRRGVGSKIIQRVEKQSFL